MKPLTLLLSCLLSMCATADENFRARVSSDTTSIQAQYDPTTGGYEGTASNTITFRDPSK